MPPIAAIDQIASKAREIVMVQIGSQVLALCEANARIAVLEERIAAVQAAHAALDKAKQE